MKKIVGITTLVGLVLALSLTSFNAASAQDGEPLEACSGDSVSGTVVAVDESTGVITLELEDESLCTVQLDGDYDHPITSLLGAYFNELSADDLAGELDALMVSISCPEGESCVLAGEGDEGTDGTVISVTPIADGEYEVVIEYMDDEGNPTTTTIVVTDPELAEAWMDSLDALLVEWELVQQDDGAFLKDAGDDIAALHADGMGYGVIVKLYGMASDAAEACLTAEEAPESAEGEDPEAETADPCEASLDSLVEAFQSGTGLGQLFQQYGKPSILGVGHVRQAIEGTGNGNTPPDNACGYWKHQPDLSPDHPCYEQQQQGQNSENGNGDGRGKPPWAGQPGGPNGSD